MGPLRKTKSGHQCLLALMCTATRYPEATPICTLKAMAVVKVLVLFHFWFTQVHQDRSGIKLHVQTFHTGNSITVHHTQKGQHMPSSAPGHAGALSSDAIIDAKEILPKKWKRFGWGSAFPDVSSERKGAGIHWFQPGWVSVWTYHAQSSLAAPGAVSVRDRESSYKCVRLC